MYSKLFIFVFGLIAVVASTGNAQVIECVDNEADYSTTKWIKPNANFKYARDETELPSSVDGVSADGIFYFQGNPALATQSVTRPVEVGLRFLYLRYYVSHVSGGGDDSYYVFPALNQNLGRRLLNVTSNGRWKEIFVPLDGTLPVATSISVISSATKESDFLLIDKIIYVSGVSVPDIESMRAYCEDEFATTTVPTTTALPTESTTAEPETTTEEALTETPSTTEPPTESTSSTTPTTTTTSAPLPDPVTEWIDVLADLGNTKWESGNLRYAASSDDLPLQVQNLTTSANGILFFQGDTFLPNQAIYRTEHSGQGGIAYLFLRYYVQHSSGVNDQVYYIFPAVGRPMGTQYLDTTKDGKWKELIVQIDTAGSFEAEVGMSTRDPENFLLIDRLVFVYRPSA